MYIYLITWIYLYEKHFFYYFTKEVYMLHNRLITKLGSNLLKAKLSENRFICLLALLIIYELHLYDFNIIEYLK